jgi:glycosyltransferase involved in cell wall biosynthesis
MNIQINYQIFFQQKNGGISSYYNNLLNEFKNLKVNATLNAPLNIFQNFNEIQKKFGLYIPKYPTYFKNSMEYLNYNLSEIYMKSKKPDIIHNSYYSKNILKKKNIKSIITVYDMITEVYANENLYDKNLSIIKKNSIDNSDHVICISQKTKEDLINYFKIDEKKITVVYLGTNLIEKNSNKFFPKKNFILYVGGRREYKNFDNFIKAYSISKKINKEFTIVAFGGEKFSKKDSDLIKKYNLDKNQFSFISGDAKLLQSLYLTAKLFVYPSLYEGFGLPILEAMANNCPTICSNTSSIPEVAGSAVKYFDPSDPENISDCMEKVIFNSSISSELIIAGLNQTKLFTWKKCAEQTIDVYKKILI